MLAVSRTEGDSPFVTLSELELVLRNLITAQSGMPFPADDVETWVMNTETGGFTRYEGFNFNSYAKIGDSYYGCAEDGIYQLDGDTDSGEPIRAMVSFGKQDFGTSAFKHISNAYIGVSSTGKLVLRVIAEGESYDYVARASDERLRTQLEKDTVNVVALGQRILDDVRRFAGNRPQSDDMCLTCFQRVE